MITSANKRKVDSSAVLRRVLVPLMKKNGFRKRGFNWSRRREAVVQVFDVQRSRWSDAYYFNFGVYDLQLGKASRPPIYECHVQLRSTSLKLPRGCSDAALDFTKRVTEREGQLRRIAQLGIAWLDQVSAKEGMGEYLRSPISKNNWVAPEVRRLYGVD